MAQQVFVPNASKTATVAITVSPSGVACQGELWIAAQSAPNTKIATSGLKAFTSTGSAQNVTFPITMPASGGPFVINFDVYVGGVDAFGFVGNDTIALISATIGPITWS